MGPRIYNLGNELCPSKPGVPEMELGYCQEKFEAFKEIGVDYWFIWPYDNGGCTCAKCALGGRTAICGWPSPWPGPTAVNSQGKGDSGNMVLRPLGQRRMGWDRSQVQGDEA